MVAVDPRFGMRRLVVLLTVTALVGVVTIVGRARLVGALSGAKPADADRQAGKVAPALTDAAVLHLPDGSRVQLWGDSLAAEARQNFVAELAFRTRGKLHVDTHTFGGTATCDWLPNIEAEARAPIAAAVLEFSGNALTKCMTSPEGRPLRGAAYVAAYRQATLTAIRALHAAGARVYLVGAPRAKTTSAHGTGLQLRALYVSLAATLNDVVFVDAGAAVLTPAGAWTETMPCLAGEGIAQGCVAGRIIVRAPDGVHFCPGAGPAVRGVTSDCPRYSSGSVRFGRAMADAVLADVALAGQVQQIGRGG
jgi:hypothetical protein